MRIGWAFTGAGHFLKESVNIAEKLAEKHEVTVFLSGAAEEVLAMYGLLERVKKITGGKYKELATDTNQKYSYPIAGRFSLGKYDFLIISPTTSNTIAKFVYGISDNLVTNLFAQAGKGAVKTLVVPVDLHPGSVDTVLPSKLEIPKCQDCEECIAAKTCPNNAIIPKTEINLLKCVGCGLCSNVCPYGAISEGRIITIYMRDIDIENTNKLYDFEGVEVIEKPEDVLEYLKDY